MEGEAEEGLDDGLLVGLFVGPMDGLGDGIAEGVLEGVDEEIDDGTVDGSIDGFADRLLDGRAENLTDEKAVGSSEGKDDNSNTVLIDEETIDGFIDIMKDDGLFDNKLNGLDEVDGDIKAEGLPVVVSDRSILERVDG